MTGPLEPSLDPHAGTSSPIDATIDPAPVAPGPLFVDTGGNLEPGPASDADQSAAAVDPARPAVDPVPLAADQSAATVDRVPPVVTPAVPAADRPEPPRAEHPSMTKASTDAPTAAPWPGGRSPFSGGAGQGAADSDLESTTIAEVPVRPYVALAERPRAVLGSGPAAVFPAPNEPTRAAMGTDVVTCPECGQLATVDMARRQADDFCRRCDFPLFWARGTVIAPEGAESGASLRRLPGTVGRAAAAALICPHCSEPNSPSAEICIRCALSLHPVDIPEPEPVVIAPPEPEPEPEPLPEKSFDWWWIVAIAAAVVAIALLIGLLYLR